MGNKSTCVGCSTSSVSINEGSTCAATIADTATRANIPTAGTVTFTLSAGTTGGSLSAASCILSAGSCSVTFTGTATGTATVLGMYGGDTSHFGSSGTSNTITVNKRSTSTNVTCTSSVVIHQTSTCTATVTDTDVGTTITPTGTVTFTSTGAGSLSASSCALSAGRCSVTFTGTATGTATVTGAYGGGAFHLPNTNAAPALTVKKRFTFTTCYFTNPRNPRATPNFNA